MSEHRTQIYVAIIGAGGAIAAAILAVVLAQILGDDGNEDSRLAAATATATNTPDSVLYEVTKTSQATETALPTATSTPDTMRQVTEAPPSSTTAPPIATATIRPTSEPSTTVAPTPIITPTAMATVVPGDGIHPEIPMPRGGLSRTGVMPGPAPEGNPVLLWKRKLDDGEPFVLISDPVLADGVLYVSSGDGLFALDDATGAERWHLPAGGENPVILESRVFTTQWLSVTAVDPDSATLVWKREVIVSDVSGLAATSDAIYGGNDRLYALEPSTGDYLWSYELSDSLVGLPAVADGMIVVGTQDGAMTAIDISSRIERWRFETFGEWVSTPAISNGTVFFGQVLEVL